VIVIVLSNAIGLVFLRIYVTNFPILTLGAFYFLRGNSGLIFAFFSICVTSYFFFLSLDQPTMVTLSTKDHTGFFISSIVHQIIPVILFKLYENESIHYQNLLSKFLESAEQKNIAKTNYISQMSHDLRTPLHGFLSIAELMKKSNLNEEQLSYLRAMDSCGNLILDIVMKILDLSKIEAGKFEPTFEKFSLFSIVQETFDSLSTLADSKSNQFLIHFQLNPIGFTVLGDRTHFREILVNVRFFFFLFAFISFIFIFIFIFIFFYLIFIFTLFHYFFFIIYFQFHFSDLFFVPFFNYKFSFYFFFFLFFLNLAHWKCIEIYRKWKSSNSNSNIK